MSFFNSVQTVKKCLSQTKETAAYFAPLVIPVVLRSNSGSANLFQV